MTAPAALPAAVVSDVVDAAIARTVGPLPAHLSEEARAYAHRVCDAARTAGAEPGVVEPRDWIRTRSRIGAAVAASPLAPPPVLHASTPSRADLLRVALLSDYVETLDLGERPYRRPAVTPLEPLVVGAARPRCTGQRRAAATHRLHESGASTALAAA